MKKRQGISARSKIKGALSNSKGEIIFFSTPGRKAVVEVRLEKDTVWLTQSQMVDLFQRDQSVIARHLNNIFWNKELDAKSNMQKMHIASGDRPVAIQ